MEPRLRAFLWISLTSHVGGALILTHAPRVTVEASDPRHDATSSNTLEAPDREVWVGTDGTGGQSSVVAGSSAKPAVPRPLPFAGEKGRHEETKGAQARGAPVGVGRGGGDANAGSGGALFGAIGDRAAVDLATAFTRGFPQAASADPAWVAAPFGSAGEAVVTLRIDDGGVLIGVDVGGSPGPALRAGIARTLALLRPRSFTSSGSVTRLRIGAKVAPDQVHDGLHGEVFAIGGSFEAAQGSAFFALAIGRRVDLTVRATR